MHERPIAITTLVWQAEAQRRAQAHVAKWGKPVLVPITAEPQRVETWDRHKLCAILQCHRTANAKDCVAHLAEKKIRGRQEDFAELRREGLAFKRELAHFHELRDEGRLFAGDAAKLIATQLGLHHIARTDTSDSVSAKCTCGFFAIKARKNFRENEKLDAAINRHLRDPEAWQAQRTLDYAAKMGRP